MKYSDYMREINGMKIYQFNSIKELYDITKEHIGKSDWRKRDSETLGYNFNNSNSIEEALDLMKNGWEQGTVKLNKAINIKSNSNTFKSEFNVVGGNVSVPRYLQGIPTNMILQKRTEKKDKVITINKSIGYHAGIPKDTIIKESVKAVEIVQSFESQGYRVNLNIIAGLQNDILDYSTETFVIKLRIKNANERLNLHKMSFPLIHPSMFRRIMFKLIENTGWLSAGWAYGYGYPMDNDNAERKYSKFLGDKEVFIPNILGDDINAFVDKIKLKVK